MRRVLNLVWIGLVFSHALLIAGRSLIWDWNQIDLQETIFPKNFLWGSGVSEYQVSGAESCKDSQWAEWESRGHPYIQGGDKSGSSADQWNRYHDDIHLMEELGLNAFRFSIEWSRVEPEEGVFDQEAINHYRDFIKALLVKGITPMATLHHFTSPLWFEKMGGFEKEENIDYFVRFSKQIFGELASDVHYWCTINEPTVLVLMGHMLGEFPPGKKDLALAGTLFKNLLVAHVKTYEALKKMPRGKESEIGIVHSYLKFESHTSFNPLSAIPCHYLTKNLHENLMRFFKEGSFNFYFPLKASVSFSMPEAIESFDFFGLNYYSNPVIGAQFSFSEMLHPTCFQGEVFTDMPYAMYPEGFYEAVLECDKLGKPVIVTENGIADAKDDRRALFIDRYLYALSRAIEDGANVKGYFYWSLIDNFEWAMGWSQKFGLYHLDLETKERTLRNGSRAYQRQISRARS